jgi:quinol monooxygenase YgiN
MAIARYQEARQVTAEDYDAVNEKMNMPEDAPEGLLSHAVAQMEGGGMRFWEVWESEDHMRRFEQERLIPALHEVFGDLGEPPQEQVAELHFFWAPGLTR